MDLSLWYLSKLDLKGEWWYKRVIPALKRPSQENLEFKGSLGYMKDPVSINNRRRKRKRKRE
jgi:hypothetical protein